MFQAAFLRAFALKSRDPDVESIIGISRITQDSGRLFSIKYFVLNGGFLD